MHIPNWPISAPAQRTQTTASMKVLKRLGGKVFDLVVVAVRLAHIGVSSTEFRPAEGFGVVDNGGGTVSPHPKPVSRMDHAD